MAEILYTYQDQVYVNLTNQCDCSCRFCIRSHHDGVGDADTLWHEQDPDLEEVKAAMDAFDFSGRKELVYCGYGEPTCALENLVESARYAKERYGLMCKLVEAGKSVIMISSEMPELLGMSDRILVMSNGMIAGELDRSEYSQARVLELASSQL